MGEFVILEDGTVIEEDIARFRDVYKKHKDWFMPVKVIPKPVIDHYAFCKSCFHYNSCCDLDYEDHMYDMTECEHYISVMTPEKFAEEMRELSVECSHGDTELAHVRMDELMCKVLKALGYGEGVDIFDDAHKWYA